MYTFKFKCVLSAGLAIIILAVTVNSSFSSEIPQKISYQGKLLESGVAVNGLKTINFAIGNQWQETHINVPVADGIYSVQLGSITPIPISIFNDSSTVSLEITVDGSPLSPSIEVLSVGYAFVAAEARNADTLDGNEGTFYLDWNNLTNIPSGFADGVDNTGTLTETDPIFNNSSAKSISSTDISNWNSSYSWGNHALYGYLKNESDPVWSTASGNYYTKSQMASVATSGSYNDLADKPVIPDTSSFVTLTGTQTIAGTKSFTYPVNILNTFTVGTSTSNNGVNIYGDIDLYNAGTRYGGIFSDANNNFIINNPASGGIFRLSDDLYLQYSDGSSWRDLYCGQIIAHDDFELYSISTDGVLSGRIWGDGNLGNERIVIKPENSGDIYGWGNLIVTGLAYKPGGGTWLSSSDKRLKDIGPNFTRGLEAINAINPLRYKYKKDNELNLPSDNEYIGLIAQEVQEVIPEAVSTDSKGYLMLNNDPVIWAMLNAIKELNTQITNLKTEIEALKEEKP